MAPCGAGCVAVLRPTSPGTPRPSTTNYSNPLSHAWVRAATYFPTPPCAGFFME